MDEFELAMSTYKAYFKLLLNFLELTQSLHINKVNTKGRELANSVGYRQVVVPFSVDNELVTIAMQNTNVTAIQKPEKDHDKRIQFSVDDMPKVYQEYLRLRNAKNRQQLNTLAQNGIKGTIINEIFYVDNIPYINPTIYIDRQDKEKVEAIKHENFDHHYKLANREDFAKIDAAYAEQLQEHTSAILKREGMHCFTSANTILIYCEEPSRLENLFSKNKKTDFLENQNIVNQIKHLFPEEIQNKIEIADSLEQFNIRKKELETGNIGQYPVPKEEWKIIQNSEEIEKDTKLEISLDLTQENEIDTEKSESEIDSNDLQELDTIEDTDIENIDKLKKTVNLKETEQDSNIDSNELKIEDAPNSSDIESGNKSESVKISELESNQDIENEDKPEINNYIEKEIIPETYYDIDSEIEHNINNTSETENQFDTNNTDVFDSDHDPNSTIETTQQTQRKIFYSEEKNISEPIQNTHTNEIHDSDDTNEKELNHDSIKTYPNETSNNYNNTNENKQYFDSEEIEVQRKYTHHVHQEYPEKQYDQTSNHSNPHFVNNESNSINTSEYIEESNIRNGTDHKNNETEYASIAKPEPEISSSYHQIKNINVAHDEHLQSVTPKQVESKTSNNITDYFDNDSNLQNQNKHSEKAHVSDIHDSSTITTKKTEDKQIVDAQSGFTDSIEKNNSYVYRPNNNTEPQINSIKKTSSYYTLGNNSRAMDFHHTSGNSSPKIGNTNIFKSVSSKNNQDKSHPVQKDEAIVYDNSASFNAGKKFTAAASLLEMQKKQFIEAIESQDVGKGIKEFKQKIMYFDNVFGKGGVKNSLDKDIDGLIKLSQSEVVQKFLKNNNIDIYSKDTFDKTQNAINKAFTGTKYNQNIMKLSKKSMSVDQAAIFGGIAKNAADRENLTKFIRKQSNAADKKKIVTKLGFMNNVSRSLQKRLRKAQSETTDSYLEVKCKVQEIQATKYAVTKIMDAKFELKGRALEKKTLQYNLKISKLQQKQSFNGPTNTKATPIVAKNKDPKEAIEKLNSLQSRNDKKKKAYEEKKARKQAIADKKAEARINGRSLTRKNKKIERLEKANKYFEKHGQPKAKEFVQKQLDKAKKEQKKKVAQKKAMNTFFENMKKNKLYKAASTVFKPLNKLAGAKQIVLMYCKTALLALAKVFAVLIIYLFAKYIITTIGYTFAGIQHMFSFDLLSLFDKQNDDDREDTPIFNAYKVLDEAERIWVQNFYDITNSSKKKDGVSLSDYEDMIDWEQALSNYPNCSYDAKKQTVKYDALGIGVQTDISKVDGNIRVEFKNYTNPTKLTNLKDIIALTTVYLENGFDPDKDFDEERIDAMKQYWLQETVDKQYSGLSKWFKKVFQKNTANPILKGLNAKDSETLAYNVYALTLFQGSHDVEVDFAGIETYPLKPYITDKTLLAFLASDRCVDENGELFVCPGDSDYPAGCQKATFTFDSSGNVYYESKQIASKLIYFEDSERCYNISSDSEKQSSPCWHKEKEMHTKTDENGNTVYNAQGDPEQEEVTVYKHSCAGHTGYYCGGHIHINATGIIHSINIKDLDEYADTQMNTQTAFAENKPIFNDAPMNEITNQATDDIFEVDAKLVHAYIPDTWIRWTAENKSTAIARYNLNWTDVYGFPEIEERSDLDIFQGTVERTYNWGSGGSTLDYTKFTGSDVEIICQIIGSHEGKEASVNPWDNDAISIGKLQWHGDRALNLLRDICKRNPTQANEILGNDLYHIIVNPKTSWAKKTFDVNKKKDKMYIEKIKQLLYTSESYQAQEDLYKSDVASYMATVQKQGITDKAAIAYCCDVINQYGSIHSCHYKQIVAHGGDLNAAYEYTVNYTCSCDINYSKYIERRKAVKAQCMAAYSNS